MPDFISVNFRTIYEQLMLKIHYDKSSLIAKIYLFSYFKTIVRLFEPNYLNDNLLCLKENEL